LFEIDFQLLRFLQALHFELEGRLFGRPSKRGSFRYRLWVPLEQQKPYQTIFQRSQLKMASVQVVSGRFEFTKIKSGNQNFNLKKLMNKRRKKNQHIFEVYRKSKYKTKPNVKSNTVRDY
jgi:hypothetical protein